LTLDDLEGQYCSINCIGCSASSLVTAGLFCYRRHANAVNGRYTVFIGCASVRVHRTRQSAQFGHLCLAYI